MRLEKIKLAGFKSFVDPTTVPFPSQLSGVVGPNGCGKSNVIDAVRWVMGESSARLLRGASMADVIFNGSTTRKPVGLASVELLFDNSDGRAGGEYANFAQISVRRQVSRDGQSVYMLNGARCRRRDIQDLFLGTGLGPRSYSIIEQGMISRFIEARPEELRLFIEEAAGISKYKERRRETENRIRHTRDNLERLTDLRDEVAKQLQHLERQAANAEKYRALKAEEQQLTRELDALRWRDLAAELGERDRALAAADNAVEAERAARAQCEAALERLRADTAEASDAFHAVQQNYYAVGTEIARMEQRIQFAQKQRASQEAELARLGAELDGAAGHEQRDRARLEELDAAIAADLPRLTAAEADLAEAAAAALAAAGQLDAWQAEWDALAPRLAETSRLAQQERGRIDALEQRLSADERRGARIAEELDQLDDSALGTRLAQLDERALALTSALAATAEMLAQLEQSRRDLDSERQALDVRLDQARTELQAARGRQSALTALQDAALAATDAARAAQLDAQGLRAAPRLIERLSVAPGWETAVETALGEALGAIGSEHFDAHAQALRDCPGILLCDLARGAPAEEQCANPTALLAQVQADWPLAALLAGFRLAEDLEQALARRGELAAHERIVTRDGTILGRDWLRVPAAAELAGSLQRAEELHRLRQSVAELETRIADWQARAETLAEAREQAEREREQALERRAGEQREQARLEAERAAGTTRLAQLRERRASLTREREELAEQRAELLEDIESARETLYEALEESERLGVKRDRLLPARDGHRAAAASARADEQRHQQQAAQLRLAIETRRAERAAIATARERADAQLERLRQRRGELGAELAQAVAPLVEMREQLETQLEARLGLEADLNAARARMESLQAETLEQERERQRLEQSLATRQATLDAQRLERQELLIRQRTLEEGLAAERDGGGAHPQDLLATLDPAAAVEDWRQRLEQVGARLTRLGNVNLAAIDEFREQSERMNHLESQTVDIQAALETLEAAIRKIDRETRARFKETYERVNAGLQQLFPRLFGGGQAYLELTDQDLLETGVTVMARPPGKRNASISMLSGGEKALTAVALVFAIFELNPAPFCMLDEVDAPLDEANVGRFCALLRAMSERIQFIFITHNRVTMEVADHLIGVTMHEPGVSRLVAVDVEAAAALVE